MQFVFAGLTPYFVAAANRLGSHPQQLNRCNALWHSGQIQTSLGQIPNLKSHDRAGLMAHAIECREGLALAIAGIDAAIREVAERCDLPAPEFILEVGPETDGETKPIKRVPTRISTALPKGV